MAEIIKFFTTLFEKGKHQIISLVLLTIFIVSGILIFSPPQWLDVILLGNLKTNYSEYLGLAFLVSAILLILLLFLYIISRVKENRTKKRHREEERKQMENQEEEQEIRRVLRTLRTLTPPAKRYLKNNFHTNQVFIEKNEIRPWVKELIARDILEKEPDAELIEQDGKVGNNYHITQVAKLVLMDDPNKLDYL